MSIDRLLDTSLNGNIIRLTIDDTTREIQNSSAKLLLGVENDKEAERIYFIAPRFVGDRLDLSLMDIYVNYINAAQDQDVYKCTDVKDNGNGTVTFSWLLSRKVTKVKGIVTFAVCARKLEGTNVTDEWHTSTHTGEVLDGLETAPGTPDGDSTDIFTVFQGRLDDFNLQIIGFENRLTNLSEEIKTEVNNMVGASLKSITKTITIQPEEWMSRIYTLNDPLITATSNQEFLKPLCVPEKEEMIKVIEKANIQDFSQEVGVSKIKCLGAIPTIPIEIRVIFRGDK